MRHRKTLFALPLLVALLVRCQEPAAASDPVDLATLEQEVAERINAHRKASKLAPFAYDDRVAAIARRHSERMASGRAKLGHDGFEARAEEISQFLALAGAAENVSKHRRESDFAEFAVSGWLASPVHRKNIDGDYAITGIGAARSSQGLVYFTQLFVRVRQE